MDNTELANAINKLAEVHDRRLGEIGIALSRLADQFTPMRPFSPEPQAESGVDVIASAISGANHEAAEAIEAFTAAQGGAD